MSAFTLEKSFSNDKFVDIFRKLSLHTFQSMFRGLEILLKVDLTVEDLENKDFKRGAPMILKWLRNEVKMPAHHSWMIDFGIEKTEWWLSNFAKEYVRAHGKDANYEDKKLLDSLMKEQGYIPWSQRTAQQKWSGVSSLGTLIPDEETLPVRKTRKRSSKKGKQPEKASASKRKADISVSELADESQKNASAHPCADGFRLPDNWNVMNENARSVYVFFEKNKPSVSLEDMLSDLKTFSRFSNLPRPSQPFAAQPFNQFENQPSPTSTSLPQPCQQNEGSDDK